MPKYDSPTQPVKKNPRKWTGARWRIRNILAVCGILVAVVVPVVLANTYSEWNSTGEEKPESQLFAMDPLDLEAGLAIVEMTHQGEEDFVIDLLPTEGEETATTPERIEFFGDQNEGSGAKPALALAQETGSADISRAVGIQTAGKYIFGVKASGPWTIQVEQPRPSGAPEPTSFSGDDNTATPLFRLSAGSKEITATNPTGGKLKVSLLDGDGNEIGRLPEDKSGQTEREPSTILSSKVDIPEDGVYVFDVQADSLWTAKISDAG